MDAECLCAGRRDVCLSCGAELRDETRIQRGISGIIFTCFVPGQRSFLRRIVQRGTTMLPLPAASAVAAELQCSEHVVPAGDECAGSVSAPVRELQALSGIVEQ